MYFKRFFSLPNNLEFLIFEAFLPSLLYLCFICTDDPNLARSEFCGFALAERLSTNGSIVVAVRSWHLAVQTCRIMSSSDLYRAKQIAPVKGCVRVVLVYNCGN